MDRSDSKPLSCPRCRAFHPPVARLVAGLVAAAALTLAGAAGAEAPPEVPVAPPKLPVHGEVGLGFGQTLFFGDTRGALRQAYGGASDPGLGNNLLMGFSVAPSTWRGVGLGARIRGTFGTPVKGDEGDDYIFNYYTLGATATIYPVTGVFGRGPYARAMVGFGQMTTKRLSESAQRYRHQYALGVSTLGALGYTVRLGGVGLSLEAEFEYSNRSGTVDGVGSTTFQSGQLGGNLVVSF